MQITDPVADMLTRIRNANSAKHDTVDVPASNLKKAMAQILQDEGYIKSYTVKDNGNQGVIHITLKYLGNKEKVITGLRRVSKPGLRVYAGADELPGAYQQLPPHDHRADRGARKARIAERLLPFVHHRTRNAPGQRVIFQPVRTRKSRPEPGSVPPLRTMRTP